MVPGHNDRGPCALARVAAPTHDDLPEAIAVRTAPFARPHETDRHEARVPNGAHASTGATGALGLRVRLRGAAAGVLALPRATNAATMRERSAAVYSCACRAGCVALEYFAMFVRAQPLTILAVIVRLVRVLASRATAFGVNVAAMWPSIRLAARAMSRLQD